MDDVENGPCKKLSKFDTTSEEPDSLALLKLYMKRRFEFDMTELFLDLLRILELDPYRSEDKLYAELSSVFCAEIAAGRDKLDGVTAVGTTKDRLMPLCQRVWKDIRTSIKNGRERMIDVLLNRGIFAPVDLQPSLSKHFVVKFIDFVPQARQQLSAERIGRITSRIHENMESKLDFPAHARTQISNYLELVPSERRRSDYDEDFSESVANIDYYILDARYWPSFILKLRRVSIIKFNAPRYCFYNFINLEFRLLVVHVQVAHSVMQGIAPNMQ